MSNFLTPRAGDKNLERNADWEVQLKHCGSIL